MAGQAEGALCSENNSSQSISLSCHVIVALPRIRLRADEAQEIMDSMASEFVEPDARCYRLAAEALQNGGNGDHSAGSSPEADRLLGLAEDMEASVAARRLEGSASAGVDLNLMDTSDLETLLETASDDLNIVEPGEGL